MTRCLPGPVGGACGKACWDAGGLCFSFYQKGKCTDIQSPRRNSPRNGFYWGGGGLFFVSELPFFSRRKVINVSTLVVSTGSTVTLLVETESLYMTYNSLLFGH